MKTYFLAPNLDYSPNSSIALGRIWTAPADPDSCINPDGPLPFPSNMPNQHTRKEDWSYEKDSQNKGLVGIWARFLQFVGLVAEAGVNWDRTNGEVYKFDKLDTNFVEPTQDYVVESVLAPPVAEYIAATNFKKRVYMITGVKTARGADVAIARSGEAGMHLKAGVDGTIVGVPAATGPKATLSSKDSEKTSFKGSSDFVFAYRLREIYYEKGQVKHEAHNKGALLDLCGDSKEQDKEVTTPVPSLEVVGLEEDDVSRSGAQVAIDEDGEEYYVVTTVEL